MNPNVSERENDRIEEAISHIAAKVADALDLLLKTKQLLANSETLVIGVQQALDEFYVSLQQEDFEL